ncbi:MULTISPECIES: LacI family DNA-binding transcriptional regulator [unclassified Aureimonas]|uniref:LacI family DNA-binding transcriptional regulator n=1 Tax=unclassified Aureimonas TaxID=2615206 RepID=UPI0007225CB5|nr:MULTISPECIES: LacI family DNA-binding transcriptional regulator [unclassified Aureimonas]ALN75555.1 hypothetical protein M673_22695 [Aureimonas sp. AU20]
MKPGSGTGPKQTSGRPGRATIRTVASDAGVSVSAVSKVLRNAYGVSDGLKERVNASIQRLGYRPNASARGMRGRSYTLGVVLSDIRNPFFSEIMIGIGTVLAETPYQPLLGVSNSAVGTERTLVEAMVDRQMDGLIFLAPRMPLALLDEAAQRIPTVVIGHHRPEAEHYDTINNDDALGAEMVVDRLAEAGLRRIAHVSLALTPDESFAVTAHREIGYRRAMQRRGLDRWIEVHRAENSPFAGQVIRPLLEQSPRPEALFCWTDACALEAISVATQMGLAIPRDLSIVGYDNSPLCNLAQNALSSVDQSGRQLGAQATHQLLERIEGRYAPHHHLTRPRLVERASLAPRD